MKPSEAPAARRDELRKLVSRYSVAHPRVYGSVLTGKDDEESDLDLLVDATEAQQFLGVHASILTRRTCQ